jgi:hypothetical protein
VADLVDPTEIETIVGTARHQTDHYGRAVSAEHEVYILHSAECRDSGRDLRQCPYSIALNRGIEHFYPWTGWRRLQDQAVRLEISRGYLVPDRRRVREALAAHRAAGTDDPTATTTQVHP